MLVVPVVVSVLNLDTDSRYLKIDQYVVSFALSHIHANELDVVLSEKPTDNRVPFGR